MTALADALLAAQRQAIAALEKAYVAGGLENEAELLNRLDAMGATDKVEQARLLVSLQVLRDLGAPAPKAAPSERPKPEDMPMTPSQESYIKDLAEQQKVNLPDPMPATAVLASKLISELKAGTYNPDSWTPF